jgi:hypothetical protein
MDPNSGHADGVHIAGVTLTMPLAYLWHLDTSKVRALLCVHNAVPSS